MRSPSQSVAQRYSVTCVVCNSHEHALFRRAFDDRYGHPALFQIVQCQQCGHIMTSPRLREGDLPELYGTYYPRKALTAKLVRKQVDAHIHMGRLSRWWMGADNQGYLDVKQGEKLLDIGCGSGFSLLIAKSKGAEAYGVEADPNVQLLAEELGLAIHQGSIHDYPFPGISFDLVVLNQVIEHIPEPGLALGAIADRLAPGGRIILVFPNRSSFYRRIFGSRWINWHIPYHLHHFNLSGFQKMAELYGLRILRHRTITPNLWTFLQLRVVLRRPIQGEPSLAWAVAKSEPGKAPNSQNKPQKEIFGVAVFPLLLAVFGVVNRCVDLLGQGDCLMVQLKRDEK